MKEAYRIAQEHNSKSHEHSQYHYDKKVYFTNLDIGDRILVRNLTPRGGDLVNSVHTGKMKFISLLLRRATVWCTKLLQRVQKENFEYYIVICYYLVRTCHLIFPPPKSTKITPQRCPTPYPSTDDDINNLISSGNAPSTSMRTGQNRQPPVQLHYGVSGTPGYVHPRSRKCAFIT